MCQVPLKLSKEENHVQRHESLPRAAYLNGNTGLVEGEPKENLHLGEKVRMIFLLMLCLLA
jgi:hypothetical protein